MTSGFELVDEQPDFVLVNKAPNVNFHDEGELGAGLFSQVKSQLELTELYPVHRLDKLTSGLVIFAKNLAAARTFEQLFREHQIDKYYIALSDKKPKKKQGLIKGDMAKSRRGMWKLIRTMENPAITQFFSTSLIAGLRAYLLKPHSGKTHQIRVALSSIGAPILGDTLYGNPGSEKFVADRGYLHAYALRFTYQDKVFDYLQTPNFGKHFQSSEALAWLSSISPPWQQAWPKC
ncbi:TIGR01621 family pseudouridine synthase [Thalassotalea euphylliae]|uniref:TIGR01621 family pseudouridine synthase n=1 Tax=Thalassotalea euphylliae TaxID=1655234 RepID=A0A3E0U7G4_9GAMM|nr:TIGR01621 family pseudouridine synthase [Thalassotalea euphylliae]REL32075.1 TIGR01621 family pseudouridine synthase [Thalassotalea euphylliae]